MRLLSALFDVALIPFDMIGDVADTLTAANMGGKSRTRQRIEDVEDNIK